MKLINELKQMSQRIKVMTAYDGEEGQMRSVIELVNYKRTFLWRIEEYSWEYYSHMYEKVL